MASSSAPVQPARYLSVFLVMLIGVYLLVFLTGDKKAAPKLGIDLQGGTRVTLTARTPDASRPSREALSQAQQIISARVNGLGVSGSEVVVDGDNLIITVPGNGGSDARSLGQTARLFIRPVIQAVPAQAPQEPPTPPGGTPAGPPPGGGQPAPPGGQPAPPRGPAGASRWPARTARREPACAAWWPACAARPASAATAALPAGPHAAAQPHPDTGTQPRFAHAHTQPRGRHAGAPTREPRRRRRHRPRPPIRARTSRSASPMRRIGGRTPGRVSSSWRCK